MYKSRIDAKVKVPYGDTILFGGSLEYNTPKELQSVLETKVNDNIIVNVKGQIRNKYGKLLAELNSLATNIDIIDETKRELTFFIYTDMLIPVGVHYMDIRIEFNNKKANTNSFPLISHSEIITLVVTKSITHPFHQDISGQDRKRLEDYE